MAPNSDIDQRKNRHIEINLQNDVNSSNTTGLEKFRLVHCALPEINYSEVDTSIAIFEKKLEFPILISSMTGGTRRAADLNRILATAAEKHQIAIGVGSQRIGIEDPVRMESFQIRKYAPTTLVFSNLGAVQLNYGYGVEECRKSVDSIGADALILHLNPLQEALMQNGDTNFANILTKITTIVKKIPVPVIIKEVGWGIDWKLAKDLYSIGVAAVDVAGCGGTSWSQVEMHRMKNPVRKEIAQGFHHWGIPTAEAVSMIRSHGLNKLLFASGGLINGIDIVKCLALGANLCGIARPFLEAANQSESQLDRYITVIEEQIKISMFAIGAKDVSTINHEMIRNIS